MTLRHLAPLAALVAVLFSTLFPVVARADQADINAASRSVVRVVLITEENGEPSLVGHGSGFAVAPDVIVTNFHVIDPARENPDIRIGIVPSQGKSGWFGRVIAIAPQADLALVKLTEQGSLPVATLFTGALGDGSDVFAVGYPGNVDLAQGLNVGDIVSPTSPVKTRGNISAGRSSKAFETILHTAAIGSGNSGGPLLDSCGRVVGANSFGTVSGDGDSEFYFAISTREILRFLRSANITPRTAGGNCRSLADLDRAEADRLAGERVHTEEEARAIATKQQEAIQKAERTALFAVLAERDNRLALAVLGIVLALTAGAGVFAFAERDRLRDARIAGGVAGVLVVGALAAWFLRPGLAEVDSRARQALNAGAAAPKASGPGKGNSGNLVCTIDAARSRVTVSAADDRPLAWDADGCANGKDQFSSDRDGWSRIVLADADDSATIERFDPVSGSFIADRYFVDLDTMAGLRGEAAKYPAPACGKTAADRQRDALAALRPLLPERPNERLTYACSAAQGK